MKKLVSTFMCVLMICAAMLVPSFEAQAESATVTGVPTEVKIGDTIQMSVSVPANIGGFVYVEYSTANLQLVSGPSGNNANGLIKYTQFFEGSAQNVTFKATTAGTATIKVYMTDAEYSDTVDKLPTIQAVTKTIKIANETQETELSADNYLSSLKLSGGSKSVSLSPSFKYKTTKYTATVANSVTNVKVSATLSSKKAQIVSTTGNGSVDLQVGANKIEVVVKAENGKTRTYTVTVTRKEKDPAVEPPTDEPEPPVTEPQEPDFELGGVKLYSTKDIANTNIPADFEKTTILLGANKEVPALHFKNGELTVLYLENESKVGGLYIYDQTQEYIYPFIKLSSENNYIVVLEPDTQTVPEGYVACTLSIEGKGVVNAYQYQSAARTVNPSDFYLVYAMNKQGTMGWYQYDIAEGTYQRFAGIVPNAGSAVPPADTELVPGTENATGTTEDNTQVGTTQKTEEELQKQKELFMMIVCIGIFVGAVLVIVVVNIILAKNRANGDEEEEDDYEGYDYEAEVSKDSEDKANEPITEKLSPTDTKKTLVSDGQPTTDDDDVEFIDL